MVALGVLAAWLVVAIVGVVATALWVRRVWNRRHELPVWTRALAGLVAASAMFAAFGAVVGLTKAFGAVGGESVDPSQKARILAEGISEAMNFTAFGLLSAIAALVGFAVLNGKTQTLEDDINESSVQVLNLVVANRQKVNLQGLRSE